MNSNIIKLKKFYQETVSKHIIKPSSFNLSNQVNQMAALFSPGLFYYYVFNFQTLKMEYVSAGVKDVLGITPEEFSIDKLLTMITSEELVLMQNKEALVIDFHFNFIKSEELPYYKAVYFLKVKDSKGQYRNILHQATTLSISEDTGKTERVIGIHTDISHLGAIKNDKVSFISLNGKQSYFNSDPKTGVFTPENCNLDEPEVTNVLTKRELEIIKLFSEGLTADQVADRLTISKNTVRTHRKNMLKKTDCSNITELVAKSVIEGVI